ncbi:MAG: hypothetical protein IJW31_10210 [Lentisphaeria bacterium]|nr:hypothetical protein [Lentisphaeria bacterium]MBR7127965.1 hypothetical protein [Lentisphaeria bacterium]
MKKNVFLIVFAVMMLIGVNAQANSWGEKILLYIPNRIVDLTDLFSVGVGVGGTVRAELMATELAKVGGSYDFGTLRAYKDWNRQYGFGMQKGWYWSLVSLGEESSRRYNTIGWVDEYYQGCAGIPLPNEPIYNYYMGQRDFWRIGGALGFLVEGEFYINPIEWVDFLTGLVFIDLRQDDFEVVDFQ